MVGDGLLDLIAQKDKKRMVLKSLRICVLLMLQSRLGSGLMTPIRTTRTGIKRDVRCAVHLSDVSNMLLSQSAQGIRMDITDFPPWVQQGLTSAGVDYFSVPEQMRYLLFQQIFLVFLGIYISRSQFGDASFEARDQAFSDKIREERRKRSGFDRPKTLEDVEPTDEWFEDEERQS